MFEETYWVLNSDSVSSNISYTNRSNLDFTNAKFLLWSRNFDSVNHQSLLIFIQTNLRFRVGRF